MLSLHIDFGWQICSLLWCSRSLSSYLFIYLFSDYYVGTFPSSWDELVYQVRYWMSKEYAQEDMADYRAKVFFTRRRTGIK